MFQDRYKSEPVEDDGYFITVLRYIHQNFVKAGICKTIDDYRWISYREYVEDRGMADREFVYYLIDKKEYFELMSQTVDDIILNLEEPKKRLRDEELIQKIELELGKKAAVIQQKPK